MLRALVCAKYSIDVGELRFDPGTREPLVQGAPMRTSDVDKRAIEEAVRLKERFDGHVAVITVGPADARMGLREALAMGADEAYLLSDSLFEGVDTLVTSLVIESAIRKIGDFDLVLCGEATADGYSSLVGPRLAGLLGIPQVTYVRRILEIRGDKIVAERDLEDGYEVVEARMPALLTVTREINEPRIPPLPAIMKASRKQINSWSAKDLDLSEELLGESGSAVKVVEAKAPEVKRKRNLFRDMPVQEAVEGLIRELLREGVIHG